VTAARRPALGVLGLVVALILPACSGGGPSDEDAAPTLSPAPDVSNPLGECARNTRIGTVYDEASEAAFEQGVTLAADQLSSRGSFNYEPVLTDGAADASEAAAATAELANDGAVSAIVSTAAAGAAGPSAEAAAEAGVAFMAVAASPDDLETGDGVFSLRLSRKAEVDAIADAAGAQLGFKRLKILTNVDVLDPASSYRLEPKLAYLLAPEEGQDPGALLRGVTGEVDPGNVVGISVYALTETGTLPDGVHIGVPWHVETPESINSAFVVDFEEAYGEEPTIEAAYGYTSVLLVARAVEGACSNERADVIAGLAETKEASSVFGRFSFTRNGEPTHPTRLLKAKNGTLTPP